LIASGVGVADEIHQAYIPSRDASIVDVFLDLIGISLVIIITKKLTPKFFKHDLIQ
jgi:VanZ family protein